MKVINRIFQALAIASSLAALVLFFTKFATMTFASGDEPFIGAELALGIKKEIAGVNVNPQRSAHILFCFFLTVFGFIFSVFSFKSKGLRYVAPAVGLIDGIYMLVIALRDPHLYINAAGLDVSDVAYYGRNILFAAIALFALFVFGTAYLLIDDYIAVKASKGAKRTIFARVKAFFKDYKSEIKKIVWPGPREVVKNTVIVLLVCLVIGLFVWLLDMGLGRLLQWILGISTRR